MVIIGLMGLPLSHTMTMMMNKVLRRNMEYEIEYLDDDRGKFIGGDLSVGYFLGLADMAQLVTTVLKYHRTVRQLA